MIERPAISALCHVDHRQCQRARRRAQAVSPRGEVGLHRGCRRTHVPGTAAQSVRYQARQPRSLRGNSQPRSHLLCFAAVLLGDVKPSGQGFLVGQGDKTRVQTSQRAVPPAGRGCAPKRSPANHEIPDLEAHQVGQDGLSPDLCGLVVRIGQQRSAQRLSRVELSLGQTRGERSHHALVWSVFVAGVAQHRLGDRHQPVQHGIPGTATGEKGRVDRLNPDLAGQPLIRHSPFLDSGTEQDRGFRRPRGPCESCASDAVRVLPGVRGRVRLTRSVEQCDAQFVVTGQLCGPSGGHQPSHL
jgi:hypothetical protein